MKTKLKIGGMILLGLLFYIRVEFFSERINHFIDVQMSNTNENIKMINELNSLSNDQRNALNIYSNKSTEISAITKDEAVLFEINLIVMILIITATGILCLLPLGKSNQLK